MRPRRGAARLMAVAAGLGAIGLAVSAGQAGATTYTVTSTTTSPFTTNPLGANPDYPHSLPFLIQAANANPGHDRIRFDIPGTGAHTIRPRSTLEITDPLTIDGYSQPGATPATASAPAAPKIAIDAQDVDDALHIAADDSDIRGLVVGGASTSIPYTTAAAILVEGDRNRIAGNHIGTDPDGLVQVYNHLGVNITGDDNLIGGPAPEDRNLISGNLVGVEITSGSENLIQGNRIGTDATGDAAIGNHWGVVVESSGNTIGGGVEGEGNLISGQDGEGIQLSGDGADGNVVQGNLVGTDASGDTPLGNRDGIDIEGGGDNLIGGPVLGEGNVIADSFYEGVFIAAEEPDDARGNLVQGNLIGVGANGAPMRNGQNPLFPASGVFLDADGTLIGGTEPRSGNLIAHSGADGVEVWGGTNNRILGNSIFKNGDREEDLGIDLEADGVTDNDPLQDLDADTGANEWQNFPHINERDFPGRPADGPLDARQPALDQLPGRVLRQPRLRRLRLRRGDALPARGDRHHGCGRPRGGLVRHGSLVPGLLVPHRHRDDQRGRARPDCAARRHRDIAAPAGGLPDQHLRVQPLLQRHRAPVIRMAET